MSNPKPRRSTSLLEQAAEVYDFSAQLRAVPPVAVPPATEPPQNPPPVEPMTAFGGPVAVADYLADHGPVLLNIPEEFRASAADSAFLASEYAPVFSDVATIDRAMLAENGMIVPGAPVGPLAEEFRLVKRQLFVTRERLLAAGETDKARSVLVCSSRPRDGKTFCAINLALSVAAERDTEVLLVDADFAKPDVLARLGLPEGPGLLDALDDARIDVESLVVRTDVPHLSVLSAGTKTASDTELLGSARTRAVLARLLEANPRRLIIFDSPPALAASPASVLAMLVGQVMLIVRADRTPENELAAAVNLLDGCEHIQLVLNSVAFVSGSQRFGSYYEQEGAR